MANNVNNRLLIILVFLAVFDFLVWRGIIFGSNDDLTIYFFDVGQGDSQFVILPGGARVLIDGGPDVKAAEALSSVLPFYSRYIDVVILSHPQADHFNGLIDVLKRHKIGVFIFNGESGPAKSFKDLAKTAEENKVKIAILEEGDAIRNRESFFRFLSPPEEFLSGGDLNDGSLVIKLISEKIKILFTGDIGLRVENYLTEKRGLDIDADVLKVAHHGSKHSSGGDFLRLVSPKISVIEVGKNNYGHPTEEVLKRLAAAGSLIFRTDSDGTVKLAIKDGFISVFNKKR